MKAFLLMGLSLLVTSALVAQEKAGPPLDPVTGMKMADNWELVRVHCTVCHSPQQYLRQKGNESTWTDTIRWMQKSGGLWPLDADTESKIITYLASNYGPDESFRRAPIPGTLLPVNPYATDARLEYEEKKKAGLIAPPPPQTKP
jgi:hypothetical protein